MKTEVVERRGIPTEYRGYRFRSRLEAKWAAMFDLLGWTWEYEPFDLPGWIPDFVLIPNGRPEVLVEVKPISAFDLPTASKITAAARKGEMGNTEILLLGHSMLPINEADGLLGIGWLWARVGEESPTGWSGAVCGATEDGVGFDFCDSYLSRPGRMTGKSNGAWLDGGWERVAPLWGKAGAVTQWRAP